MKTNCIRILIVTLAICTVVLSGCKVISDDDSPEGLAARAENALESGHYGEAHDLYSEALDLDQDNPHRSDWFLGKAVALMGLARYEEALLCVREAASSAPDPKSKNKAFLLEAEIEYTRNSYLNSMGKLAEVDIEMLDKNSAETAIELAVANLENLDTRTASSLREDNWLEVFVLLALERKYAEQGDFERSILFGIEIDRLFPDAHEKYGSPEITEEAGAFFALVLPLTGEGSVYASEVANGVSLAFDRFDDLHGSVPELVVIDTGEPGADLESVIQSLGINPRCLGIVGPLTSSSTLLAAPIAEEHEIPLISPTATSAEIDRFNRFVHRLVISKGDQAVSIAEYAVRTAGCRRLAIIHAFTSESVAESEQFTMTVEELGADIVATEGYQIETTDFKDQIMAVKAYSPDGIFLPVSAWDAVQIAPQLRFYRIEIPMFGTSGWDNDLLIRLGDEYVDGAVFAVAFGTGSLHPTSARFVYNYQRRFNSDPSSIAAQGYDTAEILLKAWEGRTHTRNSIERALQSMRPYFGTSGRCTLGTSSVARISYPLLTITDGEIVSIE